ncbi:hypothetical protein B7H23_09100 [Notoacmeibacter marinus]|uniref:Uncharacterized protein n=1 Tax=Notoacmeibacter marinus TaxID=1876515 RepID=A0A231UWI2_9HYPH|nr:hypothetical protein [Notoacmeibacter marinus]OXT00298.1 hypothetical protein B7H23_09100 [Notoacmeibacter marinus]
MNVILPIRPARRCRIALAVLALAAFTLPAVADTLTYRNDRFGTTIRFPTDLFDTLTPPANGDGQTFLGPDEAELIVYGSRSDDYRDLAAQARQQLEEITLDRVTRDWFAISGFDENGNVFYQRTERGAGGVLHTAILRYPTSQKPVIDPQVGRIMRTLTGP